jgi:hypothetical protein
MMTAKRPYKSCETYRGYAQLVMQTEVNGALDLRWKIRRMVKAEELQAQSAVFRTTKRRRYAGLGKASCCPSVAGGGVKST